MQHNLDKGLKLYGTQKKTKQLHNLDTFEQVHSNHLLKDEQKIAIASLMFLTEKKDGMIKAMAYVDGCKQGNTCRKLKLLHSQQLLNPNSLQQLSMQRNKGTWQ